MMAEPRLTSSGEFHFRTLIGIPAPSSPGERLCLGSLWEQRTDQSEGRAGSSSLVSERRLNHASQWFCERLLRGKKPSLEVKSSPARSPHRKPFAEESDDLVAHFQSLRPISSENDDASSLQKLLQGQLDRTRLSFALVGRGAHAFLGALLSDTFEGVPCLPLLSISEAGTALPPVVIRFGAQPKVTTKLRTGGDLRRTPLRPYSTLGNSSTD